MKVTIWTLAKTGPHGELIVTAHSTRGHARKMLEHALVHEEIGRIGDADVLVSEATLPDLLEAWQVHFDGPCLIEPHEVDVPLLELDKLIVDLKDLVSSAKSLEAA